jgi:hypothetical protein
MDVSNYQWIVPDGQARHAGQTRLKSDGINARKVRAVDQLMVNLIGTSHTRVPGEVYQLYRIAFTRAEA